jgi:hypothetical protein
MRVATGRQAVVPVDESTFNDDEDAPRNPSSRTGLITAAAAAARKFRNDADETPADGVAANTDAAKKEKPPKKRRRPGWLAVILGVLTAGPGWTELKEFLDGAFGDDDTVSAAELGELRGRLDEQSRTLHELSGKLAANEAGDLEANFNGALEFRHLDRQIGALGKNIEQLLDAENIPVAARATLIETPLEIDDRHDREIRAYRQARAKADREALKRSLAENDSDTVEP